MELAQPQSRGFFKPNTWYSPGGEIILAHCEQNSCHWLRFPGLADFCISANAKEISSYPTPETPQETIRHLLLDQVLPRCLAHQGKIMLHASAVLLEQGLLLFLGDSGAGKSTMAGNFHQAGHLVVSDDCLWVKEGNSEIVAVPSYGGLRLWEDSLAALFAAGAETHFMTHYSSKKRVSLDEYEVSGSANESPVLAVIMLAPADQPTASEIILERLSHREAFIALLKQTFLLDLTDLDRMTRHVGALGHIVPKVPAYRLSMPRDYALLPLARKKILETVL